MVPIIHRLHDMSRHVMLLLMLLLCPTVWGGSLPTASSAVPGVLLAAATGDVADDIRVYFGTEHSADFVARFRRACTRQQRIWALGESGTLTCLRLEHVAEGGNGPVHALQLHSKAPLSPHTSAIVVSLSPIMQIAPTARRLTAAETQAVAATLKGSQLRQSVQKAVANGAVQVLDFHGRESSIYLVKWKRLDEGDVSNDQYVIINRTGKRFRAAGSFEGKIVRFLDVNNDGHPDVQRSINCDGICEAVTAMFGSVEDLVSIYNH